MSWNIGCKIRETLCETGHTQISSGRVGMFICLFFSMGFSLLGLHYNYNNNALNYCSLIALQFLGTAVLFYGSTKTSEAFRSKWVPDPAVADSKMSAIVDKVVSFISNKQSQSTTQPSDTPQSSETPDAEGDK